MISLSSCSPSVYRNYSKIPLETGAQVDINPWFRGNGDHFLFHSDIDVFRDHFTGLMVIKPLPESDYRVIFINEVGIKIFDMEFNSKGGYTVHYCIEFLNRKLFIKTLKNDISLMLNNQAGTLLKTMEDRTTGNRVLKFRDQSGIKYLLVKKNSGKVEEIIRPHGTGKKVRINYHSQAGNEPDSVSISHYNIRLKIHLSKINENN